MKTEDLQAQGLTQEQIDFVFQEHGKEVNAIKGERDNLQTRLNTAQETLKGFEGVDATKLQTEIANLKTQMANDKADYEQKIAERDFNDLLGQCAKKHNARDVKAVVPFLDVEKLKASKNQEADIDAEFEKVKKEHDYLFTSTKIPRVISSTPGSAGTKVDDKKTQANQAIRSLFGK